MIKIKESIPKARPIYTLTPTKDDALRSHLSNALKKDLIRATKSPYGDAVFSMAKKDESLIFVTNYCALKEVTIKSMYHLPLINKLLIALVAPNIF